MGALTAGLTDKQIAFITHYIQSLNATEAARLAGYAEPNVQGPRLLVNVGVRSHINEALKARGMGVEEVVSRLSDIARASVEDLYDIGEDGTPTLNLKKAKERGALHLVAGIKQTPFGPEVRLHNSLEAMEKLAKVHRLYGEELPKEQPQLTKEEAAERAASILAKAARKLREQEPAAVEIVSQFAAEPQ